MSALVDKTYTWNNNYVTFLKNGKMNAFGNGSYSFLDKDMVNANFGGREHEITFNEDFTELISVRKYDNEIIKEYIV